MSTPTTKNVLVMEFNDAKGKLRSIRITEPKPDLTAVKIDILGSFNS